uniref:Uncharacterized protein n=1 Tax=Rhodnius prolixus TaxID=13249 RepID=T1I5K9_RHOPR
MDAKGLAYKEDLDELKTQFSALQDENMFLRASVEYLQKRNDTLEYRMKVLENEGRKNNLLFKDVSQTLMLGVYGGVVETWGGDSAAQMQQKIFSSLWPDSQ